MAGGVVGSVGVGETCAGDSFRRRSRIEARAGGIASSIATIATATPIFAQRTASRSGFRVERSEHAQRVRLPLFIVGAAYRRMYCHFRYILGRT